jgi:SPP1 family predicted phage head-tail adaptor
MRMIEVITLRDTTTAPDANGLATTTNVDKLVYAELQSVKRAEFYAAQAAGAKVDAVFIVNADEYTGQMTVIHGTDTYKVTRTYQDRGRVELTCTKR